MQKTKKQPALRTALFSWLTIFYWISYTVRSPQKHSRISPLERALCSLFLHLSTSLLPPQAALRCFAPRRYPTRASFLPNKKTARFADCFLFGGEGETRTPAPVSRPTPLAGAPRHQLEYFSKSVTYIEI